MFWSWLFPERKMDGARTAEKPVVKAPTEARDARSQEDIMPAAPFDPTPPAAIGIPTPVAPTADAGLAAAAGAAFLFGAEVANRMHPQTTADAAHQGDGMRDGRGDDANHHHGNQGTMVSDLGSIGGGSGDGGVGSV
jgi:hypothetical protein